MKKIINWLLQPANPKFVYYGDKIIGLVFGFTIGVILCKIKVIWLTSRKTLIRRQKDEVITKR